MKPTIAHVFLIILLACSGCRKHIDIPSNPTGYLLAKLNSTGPNGLGTTADFSYNSNNRIAGIVLVQSGQVIFNGMPKTWHDTTTYNFYYTNGMVSRSTLTSSYSNTYYLYEYNAQKLVSRRTEYQPFISYDSSTLQFYPDTLKRYNDFRYDARGNMIELFDSTEKPDFHHLFTYDDRNNLASETIYELDYSPSFKLKMEWPDYDNKVNFVKAISGLPVVYSWDNSFFAFSSTSAGNFITEKYYPQLDTTLPFGSPGTITNAYTYNDAGLPVRLFTGLYTVIFDYRNL